MTAIGATDGFVVHSASESPVELTTPRLNIAMARARIIELAS